MASLRERDGTYYIVFTKRVDGELKQAACSLRTEDEREAEALCQVYGKKYDHGEINPFGGWTYQKEVRRQREEQRGRTIAAAVDAFLESRSHVKEKTRKGYRHKLSGLAESIGRSMPVDLIQAKDIRGFCFRENLARETQRTYLRHCKMLFRWLEQKGWVEKNVCEPIRYPRKQEKTAEKMINKNELKKLFRAFKRVQREKIKSGQETGLHVWFKPVVLMGFYQGLRVGEIVQLNWLDVSLGEESLGEERLHLKRTKNGKQRAIPIRKKYLPCLVGRSLLQVQNEDGTASGRGIWYSAHGRNFPAVGSTYTVLQSSVAIFKLPVKPIILPIVYLTLGETSTPSPISIPSPAPTVPKILLSNVAVSAYHQAPAEARICTMSESGAEYCPWTIP